jgi:hypothetical protein
LRGFLPYPGEFAEFLDGFFDVFGDVAHNHYYRISYYQMSRPSTRTQIVCRLFGFRCQYRISAYGLRPLARHSSSDARIVLRLSCHGFKYLSDKL